MDVIERDVQNPVPWTIMYPDDVILTAETKTHLEQQVQKWHDRLMGFGSRLDVRQTEHSTTDKNEARFAYNHDHSDSVLLFIDHITIPSPITSAS
ncbi:hypothetical protein Y032_0473g2077 [Ancylostoma ceylanicum]|uniref:Reverse transcriptase domain-containing protein n=1 Tax=Ancylostoma ceylanicum TaxID=53326 RepID=A0A016WW50_9BILA|nr:hypothetical protein Y032_0473g2077 [Ancylostoma ceylanicum]